jgi:ADP-heptose:LPS heptosyltransferase
MPPEREWRAVRRVLAARLDNVGDVVGLGPALRAVRSGLRGPNGVDGLPEASITLWTSPAGNRVAPMLPWVDDVLVSEVVWQDASGAVPIDPERELALVDELRRRHFDAALLFTSFSQSPWPPAYACYLAGIPLRAGESKEFGGSLLTHRVATLPDAVHQADRNLHLVESLGFSVEDRDLELRVPPEARRRADALLNDVGLLPGDAYAVVAPGASCPARRYDPDRFGEVARGLARFGLPVVVVGSERERPLADVVTSVAGSGGRRSPVVSLVGETSVPELAAVVERAALVVANDSGPMHLADAFNRPVVVLYSGTELESQWRPRRAPCRLLRRPTTCSPCYRFECPYGLPCLDIPPAEVLDHALALLAASAHDPSAPQRPCRACAS